MGDKPKSIKEEQQEIFDKIDEIANRHGIADKQEAKIASLLGSSFFRVVTKPAVQEQKESSPEPEKAPTTKPA